MNFIVFLPIYVYVYLKKNKDFKDSQIAMNESLWEGRYMKLASIRNMAPPIGIKLVHETRTLSIKKYGPITDIIATLAQMFVSNILKI